MYLLRLICIYIDTDVIKLHTKIPRYTGKVA